MKDYKKLNLPLLTTKDEEYHLLADIADLYLKQDSSKTERKKSGDATEIVVREYLVKHGLNMALDKDLTPRELTIKGYKAHNEADRIDALSLKPGVNQHKLVYEPQEVDTVIEIKKTAASDTVSDDIHRKFKALEAISSDLRFAVIVLSERLLSPTPYKNAICDEKVNIKNCKVFTCVLRRTYLGLHHKATLVNAQQEGQLWKSGEWQAFLDYLAIK
jgi:hypothetical protein